MSELARITAHYRAAIVERAGLRGFDESRAELAFMVGKRMKQREG